MGKTWSQRGTKGLNGSQRVGGGRGRRDKRAKTKDSNRGGWGQRVNCKSVEVKVRAGRRRRRRRRRQQEACKTEADGRAGGRPGAEEQAYQSKKALCLDVSR